MTAPTTGELADQEHRRMLLALARRQIRFPWMDVTGELALHSTIGDEQARERAFDELCKVIADGSPACVITGVLDLLRGGAA